MKCASVVIVSCLLVGSVAGQTDGDNNPILDGEADVAVSRPPAPPVLGIQVFDNQAAFLAATGPLTTEDFESYAATADCDSGPVGVIDFGPFRVEGATPSGLDPLKILDIPCSGNHNTTPGGTNYLSGDADVAFRNTAMDFEFDDTICAFGLFIIDAEQGMNVWVNGVPYFVPPTGDGGEAYFGIIDRVPFVTVELRVAVGSDSHYSVDDVSYGCPECFLVVGNGFGADAFYPGIHQFETQVGQMQGWYGTLMDALPEFVLPHAGSGWAGTTFGQGPDGQVVASDTPAWMADGEFTVQIVMWNPGVFPQLPEQFTNSLWVKVRPDGSLATRPFGPSTGMTIWAETGVDAQGRATVRFPFTIPGL